ncbi:MAG: helix-turn-helix domain-containing protein, partial [Candidatus Eisenbacteria bacterium]|nr:helix-turn-helix domain-containing protein [Candidatus Eisenbacteria bacterium]
MIRPPSVCARGRTGAVTDDPSRLHISSAALFRYQVVSEVLARVLAGMNDAQAIRDVLRLPHVDPRGRSVRLTERTVYRWLRAFRSQGVEALENRARRKIRDSTVLSRELVRFLEQEKKRDPKASVPELIRRARELGHIGEHEPVDRTSVWRACKRLGLPLTRPARQRDRDMRRFAYSQRMLMALADGKHFRAGTQRLKRVALCFIDDATRFTLGGLVGTSESTELFLRALHQVILDYGMMRALFLDNGGAFISDDTRSVAGRLRFSFIYGTEAYPEGLCPPHGYV